nr:uncharacterized protein LOC113739022 [Coffea arabica]
MRAKYCRQCHPCMVGAIQGSSYVWRRMLQVREVAEQNLWWLVRSGQCNFWSDNWLGSGPLCQRLESVSDHSVADFMMRGQWNLQLLRRWVPNDIVTEIVTKLAPTGSTDDSAVWGLTEWGDFSIASSYVLISRQTPSSFMFDKVWHPLIPIKISFFMVRLMRDRLPLASSLGRLHVHGPSKCFCCSASHSESLEHIFADGDLAQFLWNFFGNGAGVIYRGIGVRSRLAGWWCQPKRNSRLDSIHTMLPNIICWHIWLAQNLAFFEGQCLGKQAIGAHILADVVGLFGGKDAGEFIGLGSCISGGGGVLRDSSGAVLFGFSIPFGELTSIQAKFKSLLFGVQQCLLRGVLTDSGGGGFSSTSQHFVAKGEVSVWRIYREANQVADALAKMGARSEGTVLYTSQSDLPRLARGALGLDRSKTPVIRVRVARR